MKENVKCYEYYRILVVYSFYFFFWIWKELVIIKMYNKLGLYSCEWILINKFSRILNSVKYFYVIIMKFINVLKLIKCI